MEWPPHRSLRHCPGRGRDLRRRRVSAVSAGDAFSAAICAASDGNELWTWGRGGHGQLGLGPQVTEQPLGKGEGMDEVGVDETGRILVRVSSEFYRPAEVDILLGDPTKAMTQLQWTPNYTFQKLVQEMVEHDLAIQS